MNRSSGASEKNERKSSVLDIKIIVPRPLGGRRRVRPSLLDPLVLVLFNPLTWYKKHLHVKRVKGNVTRSNVFVFYQSFLNPSTSNI